MKRQDLRRQLELRIIAYVLAGVALGCFISAVILFCLEIMGVTQ